MQFLCTKYRLNFCFASLCLDITLRIRGNGCRDLSELSQSALADATPLAALSLPLNTISDFLLGGTQTGKLTAILPQSSISPAYLSIQDGKQTLKLITTCS